MPTERDGNRDIKNRRPSINKLRRYTGWYPERTWQEAVKNANEHYKHPDIKFVFIYYLGPIQDYTFFKPVALIGPFDQRN